MDFEPVVGDPVLKLFPGFGKYYGEIVRIREVVLQPKVKTEDEERREVRREEKERNDAKQGAVGG